MPSRTYMGKGASVEEIATATGGKVVFDSILGSVRKAVILFDESIAGSQMSRQNAAMRDALDRLHKLLAAERVSLEMLRVIRDLLVAFEAIISLKDRAMESAIVEASAFAEKVQQVEAKRKARIAADASHTLHNKNRDTVRRWYVQQREKHPKLSKNEAAARIAKEGIVKASYLTIRDYLKGI